MIRRTGLLLLAAGAVALAGCGSSGPKRMLSVVEAKEPQIDLIGPVELAMLIEAGQVVLVDVRTPEEFAEVRIAGAINQPLDGFDPAAVPRRLGQETIFYCASSRRSAIAAEQMAGYLGGTVRHLEGGIAGWQAAGLPTVAGEPDAEQSRN